MLCLLRAYLLFWGAYSADQSSEGYLRYPGDLCHQRSEGNKEKKGRRFNPAPRRVAWVTLVSMLPSREPPVNLAYNPVVPLFLSSNRS